MKILSIRLAILGLSICFSIAATAQSNVDTVYLSTDNDTLVNVAYKTINKKDVSNAISVYNPEDYIDKNFGTYAFEGIDAMVGGSNLWNLGDELILIDGVPRSKYAIITSEIDQITFLKGVNATVLYGSRASNGVVLITTKKGKKGGRESNVYVNAGLSQPKAYPEYLGASEYMQYYNQARLNDGLTQLYDSVTLAGYNNSTNKYKYPDVDYYSSDYLRKTYNTYSAIADFSGGNERATFYALAGITRENSLLSIGQGENEGNNRLNLRGNIDLKLNDYIRTYVNMSNVFYDSHTINGNYWDQSTKLHPNRFSPLLPIDHIYNEEDQILADASRNVIDGKYLLGGTQEYLTNPIADAYVAGYRTYTTRDFQYTSGLDIDLRNAIEGLSFHGQMGIDYSNSYIQSVDNEYAIYAPQWNDSIVSNDSILGLTKYNADKRTGDQNYDGAWNQQVIDFNGHFDYNNTFSKVHNVSAMLLAAGYRGRQTGSFQYTTNSNLGLQFGYNYAHKYYADFSAAVVNSAQLPEQTRVAFSPTVNFGWLISDEDFLKNSSSVDYLKMAVSAGLINTDVDLDTCYLYEGKFEPTAYFSWADGRFTNRATTSARGKNLDLTYAKRKEINVRLEGALFNNTISFNTNIFLIVKDGIPVQSYTQYPNYYRTYWPETSFVPFTNFEENSYQGLDFQINYKKQVGDFNVIVGASGTYVQTKALVRDEFFVDTYRNRAGQPTGAIFGLESDGLFMDQADIDGHEIQKFGEVQPGDIKYKDQNGDGVIDERDEVMIGNWDSPFTGGVHITAEWKNLSLFVLGTYQLGGTALKDNDYFWVYGDRKYSASVRESWTEETKATATYPRLTTLSGDNNFRSSDFWTYNTNRFDLAKVQLTYTLPKSILDMAAIKDFKIYASGSNLLTISKNADIFDLRIGDLPHTRFFNLGVKAKF